MKKVLLTILLSLGSMMAFAQKKQTIEITSVRLSAAGHMLDLRYRVNNIEKASEVLVKGLRPYIIDEKTGRELYVPAPGKVGPLRQIPARPLLDKTYFMIFANPGRKLKSGDKVSVVLNKFKVQHLTVQ